MAAIQGARDRDGAMARLIVIDDETLHRRGIEQLDPQIEVVAWFEAWPDVDVVLALDPDVVLADVSIDESLGFDLGMHQRMARRGLRVVVHTSHGAAPWLACRAKDLGCRAFLSKRTPAEELRDVLLAVADEHLAVADEHRGGPVDPVGPASPGGAFIERLADGAPELPRLSPTEVLAIEQELTGLPCYDESSPVASADGFRAAKKSAIDRLLATGMLDNPRVVAPDRLPPADASVSERRAVERKLAMQAFARLGFGTVPTPTLDELRR